MADLILYTMDEAAEKLRIKRRRLQMLLQDFPFYRQIGRRKLFTPGDLKKIVEALPCPSRSSNARGRPTGTSEGLTSGNQLTDLLEVIESKSPSGKDGRSNGRSRTGVINLSEARAQRSRMQR
ncbi:MAG: hypothetical protein V3S55_06145 [Nitrospiraceae bacterium]